MPHDRRVVRSRTDRRAVELGPAALPGVIVHELLDGGLLISWPYTAGRYAPDAVYETTSVRDVSDRGVRPVGSWGSGFGVGGASQD